MIALAVNIGTEGAKLKAQKQAERDFARWTRRIITAMARGEKSCTNDTWWRVTNPPSDEYYVAALQNLLPKGLHVTGHQRGEIGESYTKVSW